MATTAYLAFEPPEEEAARRISAELERNGWTVTPSGPDLRVQERLPALVQAIGEAAVFMVITSPAAHESAWIQREVAAAINNGRPIIIVHTADVAPDSWMRATLDTSGAIDLRSGAESEALTQIVERARAASGRGRVIAMLNIKGGVGKTVLAANLFAAAHLADKRSISFIDLDPQHNLTQYFLSPGERNRIRDRNHTIYNVVNPRGDASLPAGETQLPMVFERYLRPGEYTVVIKLEDLNNHRFHRQLVPVSVPTVDSPEPEMKSLDPESARLYAEANQTITSGENTLRILRPPAGDLLTGLVRFDTLTTGKKPSQVSFFLNGKPILSKRTPPYGVELDLGGLPRVHQLRVASLDGQGQELASDELRINTNPNRFAVRFVEPKVGKTYKQSVRAEVDVEVPENEVVERVELFLNDTRVATLYQPPYTQALLLPPGDEISYLRAVAYLADGNSTERVAFVNAPEMMEQVDISFVELFTAAADKTGRPVPGLTKSDFKVEEDGQPQEVLRFETVTDLPVHVEVMLDLSASMEANLEDARQAALSFLEKAVQPKDRAAIVTFNDRPTLAVKLTNEPSTLAAGLAGLKAERGTALYDSLVFGLYYLSAIKGQRAVLVLSDGNDESSKFSFDDTLDYARRTGIAIYTIGLGLGRGERDARKKLQRFAEETGGQAFAIESVTELPKIYDQILLELRSKYYLAYQSSNASPSEKFRTVEVKVRQPGVEAKTIRGYYP